MLPTCSAINTVVLLCVLFHSFLLLSPCQFGKVIGCGGSSVVKHCTRQKDGKEFAVKIINKKALDSETLKSQVNAYCVTEQRNDVLESGEAEAQARLQNATPEDTRGHCPQTALANCSSIVTVYRA